MRNLSVRVLEFATQRPEGAPLCAKELLHLGTRAAVDQALSRLARAGSLMRSGRGLYVLPVQSRFGVRAPAAERVVAEMAKARSETIATSGAAAANTLGLTSQVPMHLIYLTSGPSRRVQLGAQTIELKHAPRWQLIKANEVAGQAIRALAWLGPSRALEGLARLKQWLPQSVLNEIAESRAAFPQWLAQTVSTQLVARNG